MGRELFDEISLNVIAFLEGHSGVSKVYFHDKAAVSSFALNSWDRSNHPCALPEDLKAFLSISDGLLVKWDARLHGETFALGCMSINAVNQMVETPVNWEDDAAWTEMLMGQGDLLPPTDSLSSISPSLIQEARLLREKFRAFDLDSSCSNGKVCLLFVKPSSAQVWFQDLSKRWFFISHSFTDYFRLLVMHLGIPNWQSTFTDIGLDEGTKRWFRFMSPERLAIDLEQFSVLEQRRRVFRGETRTSSPPQPDKTLTETEAAAESAGGMRVDLENLEKTQSKSMPKKKRPQAGERQSQPESWAQQRRPTAMGGKGRGGGGGGGGGGGRPVSAV